MTNEVTNNQPESPAPAPKSKLPWIIGILVVIIVAGLIYIFAKQSEPSTSPEIIESAIATDEPSSITEPASPALVSATATTVSADWKTYTNDTYGFSFKYPSDWSYKTYNNIVGFAKNGSSFMVEGAEIDPISVSFVEANNRTGYQIAVDDKQNANISDATVKAVTIAGIATSGERKDYLQTISYVVNSKTGIQIGLVNSGSEETNAIYEPIYSQILSTFQFTK